MTEEGLQGSSKPSSEPQSEFTTLEVIPELNPTTSGLSHVNGLARTKTRED